MTIPVVKQNVQQTPALAQQILYHAALSFSWFGSTLRISVLSI